MNVKSYLAMIAVALAVLPMAGCRGEGKVAVSGTVLLDGKPVDQGTIRFAPADGKGPTDGATIEGGRYSVQLTPGDKSVHIDGHKKVGEVKYDESDPLSPMKPIFEEILNTDVTAEVSNSRNDLDFELTSR